MMKRRVRRKIASTLIVTATIVGGLALEVSANGAGGGGGGGCLVQNPGNGATAIRGVAAVVIPDAYTSLPPSATALNTAAHVDMTLRVQKGTVVQAFRLQLSGINLRNFLDNSVMACLFLDPMATGNASIQQAVGDFVGAIAQFFGVAPVTRFVITLKSITNTEPVPGHDQQICADVMLDPATGLPVCVTGTFGVSSVADIVFYTQ